MFLDPRLMIRLKEIKKQLLWIKKNRGDLKENLKKELDSFISKIDEIDKNRENYSLPQMKNFAKIYTEDFDKKLEIDPLSTKFDVQFLTGKVVKKSKQSIKNFLLDQKVVSGIGKGLVNFRVG